MKIIATILLLAVALVASGCASKTIEATSTKLSVSTPLGKSVSIELPKNVQAENLLVEIDPTSGKYKLSADSLKTDAATVIERAGAVQAEAVGKLADTVSALAPLIIPTRSAAQD